VLGRSVETAFVPPDIRAAVLAQEGVPPEVARALLGMYDGIASGRVEHEQGTEQRRGSVSLAEAVERIVLTMGGK
ncbi:NmrA family protein, partial [Sinorhizobium medicae]